MGNSHRVVIIGGGFGGLRVAQGFQRAPVDVTLIDKRNFHLFQPLLYQVATGSLSPANIASPLRAILKHQQNTKVILGEVKDFHVSDRQVVLTDDTTVLYDTLVVAVGIGHSYFGHNDWMPLAPGLKTVEDARVIRDRVLRAFEAAERTTDLVEREALLTFVVVGAGPTGVELAGALEEIAKHTLHDNFRNFKPEDARIILIEHANHVLPVYPEGLSKKAEGSLTRLGVSVRTGTRVTEITQDNVSVQCGDQAETIATRTVLWAAGVQATPLAKTLADATGATVDRMGRVIVEPDLSVCGHPEILVIGDMAHYAHQTGSPLAGVAPVAVQQGQYVAKLIQKRMSKSVLKPFRYHDYGTMATIGRAAAVANFGRIQFAGLFAWLAWLFIHLMYLVSFHNRVLVLMQWAWNYMTWNRAARLITYDGTLDLMRKPAEQRGTTGEAPDP